MSQQKILQRKINRRRFLGLTGIAITTGALACVGSGALLTGEVRPNPPLIMGSPELTFGDPAKADKILVAYATAAGSTGGVAEFVGRTLAEQGATVDVRSVQSIDSLDGYRAAVVGSAIHGGKWLPEADEFIQIHQDALRRFPVAFFLVGMMAASQSESNRNLVANFLEAERALVSPVAEGRFTGALSLENASFLERIGLRFFLAYCGVGFHWGDFRDPNAIRAWAESIHPQLIS